MCVQYYIDLFFRCFLKYHAYLFKKFRAILIDYTIELISNLSIILFYSLVLVVLFRINDRRLSHCLDVQAIIY